MPRKQRVRQLPVVTTTLIHASIQARASMSRTVS
jgi:hypothetical protein